MLAVKVVPAGLHLDRYARRAAGGPPRSDPPPSTSFPPVMIYRVQLEFGRNIQASSKDEAFKKMCALMKEHPESFIRDVRDAAMARNPRPLWKMLLTGR